MYSRKGGMKVENRIEATIPLIKRALIKTNTNKKDHVLKIKEIFWKLITRKNAKKAMTMCSYHITYTF